MRTRSFSFLRNPGSNYRKERGKEVKKKGKRRGRGRRGKGGEKMP